jgi:ubiquinol-cytochrome c reductase cytochrome c1 subunit
MFRDLLKSVCAYLCPSSKSERQGGRIVLFVICAGVVLLAIAPITMTALTSFVHLFNPSKETAMSVPPEAKTPNGPPSGWPEHGITGAFDRAALQRGFQVYSQVCSTCHSLKLLAYRDLSQLGFNEAEVKAIASNSQVTDGPNDQGEMFQRPAIPSDPFVSPFPNDKAARAANNGALPPDLSLIIKAREGHEDYVYSILTGFGQTPPADETIAKGMNYNPYFAGHQIAMPPPLHEGAVSFADGTPATVEQMAKDVVQFLAWASEPHLEERHETGIKVVLFLVVFAGVMYKVKKRVWKKVRKS